MQKQQTEEVVSKEENSNFFIQLWDSVFTPGTTPALITATHFSFLILITVFVVLVFISRPPLRIHFINMLIISIVFYGVVVWFINELQNTTEKGDDTNEKKD